MIFQLRSLFRHARMYGKLIGSRRLSSEWAKTHTTDGKPEYFFKTKPDLVHVPVSFLLCRYMSSIAVSAITKLKYSFGAANSRLARIVVPTS